jgi:hypothetical protein
VGATNIAEFAGVLEDAGLRGDMGVIAEKLEVFREKLRVMVANINRELNARKQNAGGTSNDSSSKFTNKEALLLLKTTLEAEDVGKVDDILNKLNETGLNKDMRDTMAKIADCVLLSDFKMAVEMTTELLEMIEP